MIPSELKVLQTEWFPDGYGSKTRCVQETVASYRLGEAQADDVDHAVTIMFEGHVQAGSEELVYNSRTQQGFAGSREVLEQVNPSGASGALQPESHGQGLWQYDIYALKSIEADIDGQPASYVVATARTYPFLQAMAKLWPLYLAGLGVALALALLMGRALLRVNRRERQLDESRQALLAAVAHELKNPLSIIRGYSEGLKEDIAAEKRSDYLDTIIDETERMDDMVVEMLALTRLANDGYTLRQEPVDMLALMQRVCQRYQRQIDDKRLQVTLEAQQPVMVTAEARLLEQATANLLSNAIRHTPETGRITITLTPQALTVANEGPTIEAAHWPHLFEPFYKAEGDRERKDNGSGLGLAIVQAIARVHGMTVDGRNEETGVAFTLHFKAS